MTNDDYWFMPKSHGYGASPKNWKGWAALVAFAAVVFAVSLAILPGNGVRPSSGQFALWGVAMIAVGSGFVWLARKKTDGEWKWRWGRGPMAHLAKAVAAVEAAEKAAEAGKSAQARAAAPDATSLADRPERQG